MKITEILLEGVGVQDKSSVKRGRKFKYDDAQDCSKVLEI